ncbi:MAG TPA: flippase [Candidatus Acidoferrales bacterium]|nr:flippase [Candidatus Acidoferrales bacterium]
MEEVRTANETSLTSGRLLARNVLWNGIGEGGPLVAAFIAMPILVHHLGIERFGVIALAWTVFGYFSLFDLGVNSAITKFASDLLGSGREAEVPSLFWTGLALKAAFGTVGAIILAASCPFLVHHVLKIPPALQHQALIAFYLMAIGLPLCISIDGLRAILEAHQRFDMISLVRSPNAIVSSLGPLAVLPFSHNIAVIIGALLLNNVVTWLVYFVCCTRALPGLTRDVRFQSSLVRGLLTFGGWETGSNIFSFLTHSADRFMIAAMISIGAVAFYVVPVRILNKLRLVPALIFSVLYPAFAHSLAEDRERARMLFARGAKLTLLVTFPILLVCVVFARELLTLWIGADFATHGAVVLQFLAISVLADGMGGIAGTLVSAAHRPDINAKIHAVLLPAYLGFAVVMIRRYGVDGAAAACLARAVVDSLAHWATVRVVLPSRGGVSMRLGSFVLIAFATMSIALFSLPIEVKVLMVVAAIVGMYAAAWNALFTGNDRKAIKIYAGETLPFASVRIEGAAE